MRWMLYSCPQYNMHFAAHKARNNFIFQVYYLKNLHRATAAIHNDSSQSSWKRRLKIWKGYIILGTFKNN